MNSPLLRRATAGSKWMRMAVTQFLRRLPVNIRPLLGVRRGYNPKGIGLCLWGYTRLYALDRNPEYLGPIHRLRGLLEDLKSKGYSGSCWGYNFDWQSRTLRAPAFTPTVVNSSFIGHALLDAYAVLGIQSDLDTAVSIKDFLLNDVKRLEDDSTFCFTYSPVDDYGVHNANLLGASLLARLAHITGDSTLNDPALAALSYSMKCQKPDGSWYYSERPGFNWIDSFHTGFNLQAIRYFLDVGLAQEHRDSYRRGVEFYAKSFFLEDGTPKYYHDRTYPVDIHSPAQAICFFADEEDVYSELTDRVLQWMLDHLYSGKGFFYFRKGRFLTNRIPYMRWSQAWAFHALTEYLFARSK